jgi:alkanesulfonate monooxygenase SsuD/methylene tetrahydromethanopterin reductase-like flavin-dependent oxidoreductase (luciferase family)
MLKLDTGGRLDMGLGRGSRPPEEVRFAIDSALEEAGFEPSVPRQGTAFGEM